MWPAISLGSEFSIPTWIAVVSISTTLAILWWSYRAPAIGLNYQSAIDISWLGLLGMVIGGRLSHVLLEDLNYYQQRPWNILRFWEGGLVFYGGLFAALASIGVYLKIKRLDWRPWLDGLAPVFAFSYATGRLGCFLNGCCYGKACSYSWGVTFHHHANFGLLVVPRHPTQLYAAFWEFGALLSLLWLERRQPLAIRGSGRLFFVWLALHSIGRVGMELLRDDPRGPQWMNLSLGIWASLLLFSVATFGLIRDSRS